MVICYPMEARCKDGSFFSFKVTDVPVSINKEEFVLVNKENSPILKLGLYRRGCDIEGIYEGDILRSEGIDYVLRYQRGFILTDKERHIKYLYQLNGFEKVGTVLDTEWPMEVNLPKTIYYKYRDTLVYPKTITGLFDGKLFVNGLGTKVKPDELQQDANFTNEGTKVFFGDLIRGYPVELYYGRPVIKHDGIIEDVITNNIITPIERN